MSKVQLFNFCVYHDYVKQLEETGKTLPEYVKHLGLDGIEHLIYGKEIPEPAFKDSSVGVHLAYWPYWVGFWKNNKSRLKREFKSAKARNDCYFGALNKDEWLSVIQQHLIAATAVKPEYMVWHVSEADVQETYTFDFQYSDLEVLEAAADVFNAVSMAVPSHITVLFENLWWPGLTLLDPRLADHLLSGTHHQRTGLLLDTGHLMNTSTNLATEDEAVRYVRRVVRGLGGLRTSIYGMHLHRSLSGAFVRRRMAEAEREDLQPRGFSEVFDYISHVDEHQPFRTAAVQALVEDVQPKFLVHEFIQDSMEDWEQKVHVQRHALGWESDAEDGQKGKTSR